jgi:hypothetical protein
MLDSSTIARRADRLRLNTRILADRGICAITPLDTLVTRAIAAADILSLILIIAAAKHEKTSSLTEI